MSDVHGCDCLVPDRGDETGPSKNNHRGVSRQWWCVRCGGVFSTCRQCNRLREYLDDPCDHKIPAYMAAILFRWAWMDFVRELGKALENLRRHIKFWDRHGQ